MTGVTYLSLLQDIFIARLQTLKKNRGIMINHIFGSDSKNNLATTGIKDGNCSLLRGTKALHVSLIFLPDYRLS